MSEESYRSGMQGWNKETPYKLFESARNWRAKVAEEEGYKISLPVAIATMIQVGMENYIGPALTSFKKQEAEELYDRLSQRPGPAANSFMVLLGAVTLRSIMESLDDGAFNDWTDDSFFRRLSLNVENIPVIGPTRKPSLALEDPEEQHLRPIQETDHIRKVLSQDKTFLSFFPEDETWREMPESVRKFLGERPLWAKGLKTVIPLYKEASDNGIAFGENLNSKSAKP